MILGTLCLIASCTGKGVKGRDYLLKPAGMFYAFAGRRAPQDSSVAQSRWEASRALGLGPESVTRAGRSLRSSSLSCRPVCVHLRGGDAAVGETHDRERGHHLDGVQLRLVLRLRLLRLRPPLPLRPGPPNPLHAPDAPQPLGDLHGRRA